MASAVAVGAGSEAAAVNLGAVAAPGDNSVAGRCAVTFSLDLACVRMRRIGNLPTMIAKFATDIPSLTEWGEPFLLGPGSIHVAHTPDEKISKKELLECVGLYVDLATELCR